jgi:hypothetical protein
MFDKSQETTKKMGYIYCSFSDVRGIDVISKDTIFCLLTRTGSRSSLTTFGADVVRVLVGIFLTPKITLHSDPSQWEAMALVCRGACPPHCDVTSKTTVACSRHRTVDMLLVTAISRSRTGARNEDLSPKVSIDSTNISKHLAPRS